VLPEADGVILIDAQTGDTQRYALAEVPEWVDRVQPEEYILNQINNKGKYIHGVFNFSNKEKFRASEGHNIVYNNGDCYYFTGITSVGVDESATGFMMVNMVTKEPILYRMSGATETSAMRSAEGKVQDLGYRATAPIILNVYGEPTYFMTLKDSARLIKKYAFVNVKEYMVVGVGDTMAEAQTDYAKALQAASIGQGNIDLGGGAEPDAPAAEHRTLQGTIRRIAYTVQGAETNYYFLLEGSDQVYVMALSANPNNLLQLTQAGDTVSIEFEYYKDSDGAFPVTAFDNLSLRSGE